VGPLDIETLETWKQLIIQTASEGLSKPGSIFHTFQCLNEQHDLLHQYIMDYVDKELRVSQQHLAFSYCWVEMGSGGRQERTLWTDQDNGIIYDCDERDTSCVVHFLGNLAEKAVDTLAEAGYPLCTGNVMASNPRWMQSTQGWRKNWKEWTSNLSLDNIRYLLISADLRPVYGDGNLAMELKNTLYQEAGDSLWMLRFAQHSLQQSVPVGVFRNILLQDHGEYAGMFHVKKGGYYQLVSLIRVLALHAGVSDSSTLARIGELSKLGHFTPSETTAWEAALAFFLLLRLKNHVKLLDQGCQPHDFIELSKYERSLLKEHLLFLKNQQKHWMKRLRYRSGCS
jgi:CBS domain-containing protein